MVEATQLKNGTTFQLDGNPYRVIKYRHQKIGRGGANVILTVKNLSTGDKEEKTLNSNTKVDVINTTKKPLKFLYRDGNSSFFMDEETYEQIEIPIKIVKDELPYLKEGEGVNVLFWEDRPLNIEIPPKVVLEVKETAPGVKGNTASNIYKPAELENGMSVKVPLFIKTGDAIRVDTRTDEYVERVS